MSAEDGTLLNCGCKILAGGREMSWCPLHLAADRLFDALTNLESMADLLCKVQRARLIISPDLFEALADYCRAARDVLAEAKPEDKPG